MLFLQERQGLEDELASFLPHIVCGPKQNTQGISESSVPMQSTRSTERHDLTN